MKNENKIFWFGESVEGEEKVVWLCFENGMINLNVLAEQKPGIVGRKLKEAIKLFLTEEKVNVKD